MKKIVSWFFFIFEKFGSNFWGLLKKSSFFGTREHNYRKMWDGGGRARGQKLLQLHSNYIIFAFIAICFHSAFSFMHFWTCNWSENSFFYCFPHRNIFRFVFWKLLIFKMQGKSTNVVTLKFSFHWWEQFRTIYHSLRENWRYIMTTKLSELQFFCYINTRAKVAPKN